jgi:predicted RNA-binding Zn ribbon-like protein
MNSAPLFELSGGHPALDFTNTVDNRPVARRKDFLHSCADLISWARQAGLLSAAQAGELSRQARRAPARAQAVLRRAVTLREALYETLSARAAGVPPPPRALKRINAFLPDALKRSRIVGKEKRFDWEFSADMRSLDRLLWIIGRAAVELLTSDDLALVRECAADDCGWLFFDRSRNRSRRWCNMQVCGNRDKVRRFRRRRGSSR